MIEYINFDEAKESQLPTIEMLVNLGYTYISVEEVMRQRKGSYSNFILQDIAVQKLMEINGYEVDGKVYKYSEKDVREAVDELENIPLDGLINTSHEVYSMIMPTDGGKTIEVNHQGKKRSHNFKYIDFINPQNNCFHVTAEYPASGKATIRPDVVCFINGIPFAIIENKKSGVEVKEAIKQMCRNQGAEFCPKLFVYTQLLVASNGGEFLYGATGTPEKFYCAWKEKDADEEKLFAEVSDLIAKKIDPLVYDKILFDLNGYTKNHQQDSVRSAKEQDYSLYCMFAPNRLLDICKNYILFDADKKKVARYQQFFAINKMLAKVAEKESTELGERRKGGLLWHTQGSGKSLTMVMFVKALIESTTITNPRVIIVTDRRDLDKQIRDTFADCKLKKKVVQATSGKHLLDLIKEKELSVVTTLVQKFESARKGNAGFVDEDQNIFVLVDEAHRTQGGKANLNMNRIIPNACYIGFTGTPLMKSERESWRKFGGYIDRYTIDDALGDKIILPLIYEGRYAELIQNNKEQVDRQVERLVADLSPKDKQELQKYISKGIIKNNTQLITEIAFDIERHFLKYYQGTGLKAQIVAPSKYSAVLFQEFFSSIGKIETAIVISDEQDESEEEEQADIHKRKVAEHLRQIREKHGSVIAYERKVIDSFKHNDEGIEIIIVVDKLLTGFDAPRNTVLYLAKDLKDHNLLQAIARVNRLYENDRLPKTAGYIIDYSANAKNISSAMKLFSNFEEEDVKSALINLDDKIDELQQKYSKVYDLFKTLNGSRESKDSELYLQFLKDEPTRQLFYKSLNGFIRTFSECNALQDFPDKFSKQLDVYHRQLEQFVRLKKAASIRYADKTDLKEFKLALIKILDKYIDAREVELLTKEVEITNHTEFEQAVALLGSDSSKAEAIAAQVKKTISERYQSDPEFYLKFSEKIEKLLQQLRDTKLEDAKILAELRGLREDVLNKKDENLPMELLRELKVIESADKEAEISKNWAIFYRNLKVILAECIEDERQIIEICCEIFKIIKSEAIIDWHKNYDVKRRIKNVIDDFLYDEIKIKRGIELSETTTQAVISKSLELAELNFEIFL